MAAKGQHSVLGHDRVHRYMRSKVCWSQRKRGKSERSATNDKCGKDKVQGIILMTESEQRRMKEMKHVHANVVECVCGCECDEADHGGAGAMTASCFRLEYSSWMCLMHKRRSCCIAGLPSIACWNPSARMAAAICVAENTPHMLAV